jgi:hypothetical protein
MPGKKLLRDKQYFTLVNPKLPRNKQRWYCHLCTPGEPDPASYMTLIQAIAHETDSSDHHRNVTLASADLCDWTNDTTDTTALWARDPPNQAHSLAELKEQSYHGYETCAMYLIPFWQDALAAAKRGEELKLEEFIERKRKDEDESGWTTRSGDVNVWAYDAGGWGPQVEKSDASSMGKMCGKSRTSLSLSCGGGKVRDSQRETDEQEQFLETVASKYRADPEKKQRMYNFYQMPTPDKVQMIQDMIRSLNNSDSRR